MKKRMIGQFLAQTVNFAVGCEESPTKLQHDRSSSICCHWDSYGGNTPFVLVQEETKDCQPVKRCALPFFGSLGLGLSCSSRLHAGRLLGEGLHLLIVVRGFALKNMEILLLLFFPQDQKKNCLLSGWALLSEMMMIMVLMTMMFMMMMTIGPQALVRAELPV